MTREQKFRMCLIHPNGISKASPFGYHPLEILHTEEMHIGEKPYWRTANLRKAHWRKPHWRKRSILKKMEEMETYLLRSAVVAPKRVAATH